MSAPTTVELWLSQQAIPLILIAVLLITGFLILTISARRRRATMLRERIGHTEDRFVEELCASGFDPKIARQTYRMLQAEQSVHFPILLGDRLDEDLGLDTADVEEMTTNLLAATGREHRPGLRQEPFVTVEDVVRFIQASPRRRHEAA
jgi:hypothetical protein